MTDDFTTKTQTFLNWFSSQGGQTNTTKVSVQDLRPQGRGRGLIAKSFIAENETVVAIPRDAILSVEASDLLELIPDEFENLDQWNALVLCMIYETRPGAKWKAYMDIFPESFDTLVYWDEEELEEMRGCEVVDRIKKEEAEEDFRTILAPVIRRNPQVFQNTIVDLANLNESIVPVAHRMMTIIMSYSFDVQPASFVSPDNESDSDVSMEEIDFSTFFKGLVPMADILNSDADVFNTRIFQSPTHLEVITLRDIQPGEELLNDYGDLPRADLLRRYGYITSNYAQYDLADLSYMNIVNACSQAFGASKEQLLERANYLMEIGVLEDQYDIDYDFSAPSELYTALKMLTIQDPEFKSLAASRSYNKASKAERVLYYPIIAQAVRERIRAYAPLEGRTPLEQMPEHKRRRAAMAREVVGGELELLRKVLQKAESGIL